MHLSTPASFATTVPDPPGKVDGKQGTPSDQAGDTAEKQALAAAQHNKNDLPPEAQGKDGIQPPASDKTEKAEKVEGEDEPSGGHHGS